MTYIPGPPTNKGDKEQNRAIWAEFQKIRQNFDQNVAYFSASESATITIGPALNWQVMSPPAIWEFPNGSWDEATGIWTCRVPGYYSLDAALTISGFGAGNQNYYAGVRLTVANNGSGNGTAQSYASGQDDLPLTARVQFDWLLAQGATVTAEGTAVHQNQTGTVTATSLLNYRKSS